MKKPDDSIRSGIGRLRIGLRGALIVLAVAWVAIGVTAHLRGSLSSDVAAQADPTPTSIRLVFDTPTPSADPTNTPRPSVDPTEPPVQEIDEGDETSYVAEEWVGGYYRGDAEWYGRPWTSVYGAYSEYPRATLYFSLTRGPQEPVTFTFEGLDDELPARNWIALEINGQRVYEGESWFSDWDGTGQGENAPWTAVAITIPPGLLLAGQNEIAVVNLTESANFGSPPYVLLSAGTATSSEGELFGAPSEDAIAVTIVVEP